MVFRRFRRKAVRRGRPSNFKRRGNFKKKHFLSKLSPRGTTVPIGIAKSVYTTFPPILRTKLVANVTTPFALTPAGADGNAGYLVWRGNGLTGIGPAGQATQGNPLGAYAAEYPAGLNYLLSSDNLTGSACPYGQYVVLGSSIRLKITTGVGTSNRPMQLVLLPQDGLSVLPVVGGQYQLNVQDLREQPYAKEAMIPPTLTSRPIVMFNAISTSKLLGINILSTGDDTLNGIYNANPSSHWHWLLGMRNADGDTAVASTIIIQATITYDILFQARNLFRSTAPT